MNPFRVEFIFEGDNNGDDIELFTFITYFAKNFDTIYARFRELQRFSLASLDTKENKNLKFIFQNHPPMLHSSNPAEVAILTRISENIIQNTNDITLNTDELEILSKYLEKHNPPSDDKLISLNSKIEHFKSKTDQETLLEAICSLFNEKVVIKDTKECTTEKAVEPDKKTQLPAYPISTHATITHVGDNDLIIIYRQPYCPLHIPIVCGTKRLGLGTMSRPETQSPYDAQIHFAPTQKFCRALPERLKAIFTMIAKRDDDVDTNPTQNQASLTFRQHLHTTHDKHSINSAQQKNPEQKQTCSIL